MTYSVCVCSALWSHQVNLTIKGSIVLLSLAAKLWAGWDCCGGSMLILGCGDVIAPLTYQAQQLLKALNQILLSQKDNGCEVGTSTYIFTSCTSLWCLPWHRPGVEIVNW